MARPGTAGCGMARSKAGRDMAWRGKARFMVWSGWVGQGVAWSGIKLISVKPD